MLNTDVLLHACLYVVIKAERVSNDSVDKGYIFPDKNDNLSTYAGGNAQLMVPTGLLQDISKCTHRLTLQTLKPFPKLLVVKFKVYFAASFMSNC